MRWYKSMTIFMVTTLVVTTLATETVGPRRCAGRLARERLKAAEKIRDKRYYHLLCCTPLCSTAPRRPQPPMTTRRYQPYHKTWWGLKYGMEYFVTVYWRLIQFSPRLLRLYKPIVCFRIFSPVLFSPGKVIKLTLKDHLEGLTVPPSCF